MTPAPHRPLRFHRRPLRWLYARSFAFRLALTTSALIIAACVIVSVMLVQRDFAEIRHSLVDRGHTITDFLAREAELSVISGDTAGLTQLAQAVLAQPDVLYCAFFDAAGQKLITIGHTPAGVRPLTPTELQDTTSPMTVRSDIWEFQAPILTTAAQPHREELEFGRAGDTAAARPSAAQKRVGTVAIGIALGPLQQRRHLAFVVAASLTAVVALAAVLSAVLLTRAFTRPLQVLARAADAIAHGDLSTSVCIGTDDEMAAMARSFNAMVQSLARSRATLEQYSHTLEARNQEMEDLLYVTSHDLRAPLINVEGFAHEVRVGLSELASYVSGAPEAKTISADIEESLRFIHSAISRMDGLTTGLLNVSRIATRTDPREDVPLQSLVEKVIESFRYQLDERHITLSVGALTAVRGDPVRLSQVFSNLIDNAIKYMGESPRRAIEIGMRNDGNGSPIFFVKDTGPGIPAQSQETVFRLFRRLGKEVPGEGLGLTMVRKIVEKHGGRIWIESAPGQGSTFCFTLPGSTPVGGPGAEKASTHSPLGATQAGTRAEPALDESGNCDPL